MQWIKRQTCYNIILLNKVSSDELAMINYLGKPQTLNQRNCCDLLIQCMEWTNTHQCTNWGWGCWTHFVDEPKAHPPCPKLLFFFTSFLPQKFSLLPTYPLSYFPPHISHLPPPSYLPPTSPLLPPIAILPSPKPKSCLEREPNGTRASTELQSAWHETHGT
jgi:hypothetical protein